MVLSSDKSEIVFFDVETTWPGGRIAILEFGAIFVCPSKLIELEHYSTLVRPRDLSLISNLSRSNGITEGAVLSAPTFSDIADEVYEILDGRIWAGHNILEFDCPIILEAFAEINRPAPKPKETLDTYELLTQKFGKRAGNMKMGSLADYFVLGQQTHRSLDDVRMNLEVLKYCAAVLFLESSRPDIFTEASINGSNFLLPEEISEHSISVNLAPSYGGTQKIQILHKGVPLEVCCKRLKVRFGVSISKFRSRDGRPRLSFGVDSSLSLCQILDISNDLAECLSMGNGSRSHWKPVVDTKPGHSPTLRLQLPTILDGDTVHLETEIYHNESYAPQRLISSRFDASELYSLLIPEIFIDAYFSLDTYDFNGYAGIRLVAKRLIIHQN